VEILAVEHASSPTAPFRVVHSSVGGSYHLIGSSRTVRTHGDADAGRRDPPFGPNLVGCSERFVDALGNDQCRLRRGHVVEEHDKLISTHPSGGVANPKHGTKTRRHIDEKLITGGMAEGVVDDLNGGSFTRRKKFAIIRLSGVPTTRATADCRSLRRVNSARVGRSNGPVWRMSTSRGLRRPPVS
jgi:hypothetical protein